MTSTLEATKPAQVANPLFPITVYGLPDDACQACKRSKKVLERANVAYTYFDLSLDENEALREELKAQNISSAPYIETPHDSWAGLQPGKLKEAIDGYNIALLEGQE